MQQEAWSLCLSCLTVVAVFVTSIVPVHSSDERVDNEDHYDNTSFVLFLLPINYCENPSDCDSGPLANSNLICNTSQKLCLCPPGTYWHELYTMCLESTKCFTDRECPISFHCSSLQCIPDAGPTTTGFWYFVFAIPLCIVLCYCFKFFCCREVVPEAPESRDWSAAPAPLRPPRRSIVVSHSLPASQARDLPQPYHTLCPESYQVNNTPPPPYEIAINLPKVLLPDSGQRV